MTKNIEKSKCAAMIPSAIAERTSSPIFRPTFAKIAWEIAIPHTGSGPGCREREYMYDENKGGPIMDFILSAKPVCWHEAH